MRSMLRWRAMRSLATRLPASSRNEISGQSFGSVEFCQCGNGGKRFLMSHQNGGDNLYTRIHRLLVTEQYAEAEEVLDEHLSRDPSSREAILSWTELTCTRSNRYSNRQTWTTDDSVSHRPLLHARRGSGGFE